MLNVVLVGCGEDRAIVPERDTLGNLRELHPQEVQPYIDLTFNGSAPVRVRVSEYTYQNSILPQLMYYEG